MKVKILLINSSAGCGGAETYSMRVGQALVRIGWAVHSAFPFSKDNGHLLKQFDTSGIIFHNLNIEEPWNKNAALSVLQIWRVIRLLRKLRPDAVELILSYPNHNVPAMIACAICRVRCVVSFHGAGMNLSFSSRRIQMYRWAKKRNQAWVVLSKDNRKRIASLFKLSEDELHVIYNGIHVPCSVRWPVASMRSKILDEFKIAQTATLLLTVGRLDPLKGFVELVQTIPHLVREFPDVIFVWVGDGSYRSSLQRLVASYGVEKWVRFCGWRNDVPEFLLGSDLLIHPTHLEGCPLAVLEAMGYGLPIVGSDSTCMPELLTNGYEALLARVGDSCSLLTNISWALTHSFEMREMGLRARQRANEFSFEKMLGQTLELFNSKTL